MPAALSEPESLQRLRPLENGEHLEADEFLRRYEAMPELKKAELVQGIVYMGSPVRADRHGRPDNIVQSWTGFYCSATPGVEAASNSTVRLGLRDVPQPDVLLQILPEFGGRSRIGKDGYIVGPPELVVEVAASSSAIDAHEKRDSYRKAGAREYLLWRTIDEQIDWWFLHENEYRPLPIGEDGIIRSRVFPGLWLHVASLLQMDRAAVVRCLQDGLASDEHKNFIRVLDSSKS
jgi:Uma2 family endonuclease